MPRRSGPFDENCRVCFSTHQRFDASEDVRYPRFSYPCRQATSSFTRSARTTPPASPGTRTARPM